MAEIEENPNNPTITQVGKVEAPYYFLIKYRSEAERVYFSSLIMKLIRHHELKDFHVEEKKAFIQSRVLYNMHTLTTSPNISYEELEKKFVSFLKNN